MDFEKLLKNHFVRLVLLAILAYFAYHYFVGVKEGVSQSCEHGRPCNVGAWRE